ncbi:4-aminobutyrate aminotransferase [Methylobacterium sp. sgz302541]|uniref:4-aminobutyrate aminotransferase n=1 Tax=unclassified Methylobacterium TaxID=2615210 RepID=UPI003D3299EB
METSRRMTAIRSFAAALAAGAVLSGAALAEPATSHNEAAASGKSVRVVVAPNLKKDCSIGPLPEFRIVTAPKNGSTITKTAKTKTPSSYRCPNKEAGVQALFYQSKDGFTGSDEMTVEIKTADGQVQTRNIRITVEAAATKKDGEPKKKDATDL